MFHLNKRGGQGHTHQFLFPPLPGQSRARRVAGTRPGPGSRQTSSTGGEASAGPTQTAPTEHIDTNKSLDIKI